MNRGNGHLFSYIKNRIQWHFLPRIQKVNDFPLHVDIEISSACDLNCPMCYTTTEEFKNKVGRAFMDFELFKKILKQEPSFLGSPSSSLNVHDAIDSQKRKVLPETLASTVRL